MNDKVIEKIFFTDEKSKKVAEEPSVFTKFSIKQMIRGTMYYRGRKIASIEDIGFKNVDEIMDKLMKQLPNDLPSHTWVHFRIENLDKNQKQDYTRMVP